MISSCKGRIKRHRDASCHISILVAAYCRLRQDELSQEVFDKLTDAQHMPIIDKECALRLLQLSVAVQPTVELPGADDLLNTVMGITCLQKRCIQVLSEQWQEFGGIENLLALRTLPPVIIALCRVLISCMPSII